MPQPVESPANFSLAETRRLVKDLFAPNPAIYWTDFLLSLVVGAVCFQLVQRAHIWVPRAGLAPAWIWPLRVALFMVSGILYYRAALFVHEIIHFRAGTFTVFRAVWNLFCGIPFLMPTFMYYTHVDHHMRKHFGTHADGEYLPLATTPPLQILLYLCQPFVIPILAIVRFLILAPLSWISPRLREFVRRRASSLIMDPSYIRPLPSRKVLRIFWLQEAGCFLFCLMVAVLIIRGRLPFTILIQAYLTSVFVLVLNHLRTLGAHRYTNAGGEMTFVEQLLDSVNYPNWPVVSALWAPVGLRFHALHHLFPSMPYHSLATAHRRLMAGLPADSPYRLTESASLTAALRQLWRVSRAAKASLKAGIDEGQIERQPAQSARATG